MDAEQVLRTLNILIVEDNRSDYLLVEHYLSREGVSALTKQVDLEADLIRELEQGHWDLVLSDYRLPTLDVRRALELVKARAPDMPFILMSGTIGEELAVDLLKTGVEDFVSKENLVRLGPAIRRAVKSAAMQKAKREVEFQLEIRNRALAAASNGVMITQAEDDFPVVYLNPAFERLTGYRIQEVIGRNLRFLHRDDDRQPALQVLRDSLRQLQPCQVVLRNYRRDGSLFWNRLSISPVKDAEGRVTHFIGIQEDMTEQREYENRLRQSAVVFESTVEGVVITNPQGNILDVNRAFSDITGYPAADAIGKNPRFLKSGRHDREFYQSMWASILQAGFWNGEIWNRCKDGRIIPEWLTISSVRDETGELTHYVGVFSDISRQKRTEEKLDYLAHHDPLTSLPNRLLFMARMRHALEHAQRNNLILAVMFLDLDRFKNINDSLGHPVGDKLLQRVAERLRRCVRNEDTVARIGGDEFTILLEDLGDPANAATIANKILHDFSTPFELEGYDQFVTVSIGISIYPRDGRDHSKLLRNADTAMYLVKDQGRNDFAYYAVQLTTQARERALLENELHTALERDQLRLHYQPQVRLETGQLVGVEALLRWEHPDLGMIPPGRFIAIAEDSGLIIEIGSWVLRTACVEARRWLDAGVDLGRMAVNISGLQIRRGNLLEITRQALDLSGLPAHYLELEVTEGFIMEEADHAIDLLGRMRELGVSLAIDDFGTGYSSLTYLKRLPVDLLKIDQSFVRDIPHDPNDMAIAKAVIALGRSLGLEVIAEGVENEEQRRFLLQEGCYLGQGYLFSRPLPVNGLLEWIAGADRSDQPGS